MGKLRKACAIAVKGILFVLIFCLILYMIMCVLLFKQEDGTLPMRNYYDLPEDTVDVLFLGSSHIGMNVSTQILWDEYGIAGYKCWGSTQPIWNTYYYLKECLEYQTPKVVVLEAHGAIFSYDYADYALQIKNTMGMRFSQNKIDAIMASAPEDSWADLLLALPTFHTRYNELKEEDFEYFPWDHHTEFKVLTNESSDLVFSFDILPDDATEGSVPLVEKEEEYLRRIIELCQEKNLSLELIASPYQLTDFEQMRFRAVRAVADEYNVRFTNFNEIYSQWDIDPHSDFLDIGHFNKYGVVKYTRAIAELLKADYALPDRRTDPDHIWSSNSGSLGEPAYALNTQFAGDGKQAYIDTGYQLFDNPLSSWTLISDFEVPPFEDQDQVIFSCYNETENNNYGLLVNVDRNCLLTVRFSSYDVTQTDRLTPGQRVRLAIVKNHKTVTVYCDGEMLMTYKLSSASHYSGNLLIGCQQLPDGTLFRYSRPKIFDLQVYESVISEAIIKKWEPQDLPAPKQKIYLSAEDAQEQLVYALDYRFQGDGLEKYIDSGVALFADPAASWTLLSSIDPRVNTVDTVYYSCFLEDVNDYHGLLVRQSEPGKLSVVYGQGQQITVDIQRDTPITLALVKDVSLYSVYVDGQLVVDGAASPCNPYDGSLLIGCQCTAEGQIFRYSGTTVYNLEIIQGVAAREVIESWNPVPMPEAPQKESSPVAYQLSAGLAGDGKRQYVDTGIQLYDVADKNWHIHMVIDYDENTRGTALSCFAEDPADYRGLLVRHVDKNTYSLILGTVYRTVSVELNRVVVLDIVKQAFSYTVYLNGEKQIEAESRCKLWDGTLLVCAERMLNGTPFRFSTQKIRQLTISEKIPADGEILEQYNRDMHTKYFIK